MKKSILFLAYFYPPLGGPGVQRPIKTIKYLKKQGYNIDVLTVGDIKFHSYDEDLLKESMADNIYRTKSFDLMYFLNKFRNSKKNNVQPKGIYFKTPERLKKIIRGLFPIDDKIGWIFFAYNKALKLIKQNHYDLIIATIGPYTTAVLAYLLYKKTNIPYIIDYRDHWTLHPYPQYCFKLFHLHAKRIETKILKNSNKIIVVSNLMKEKMITEFGDYLRQKTSVMYNGFDEDDFININKEYSKNDGKLIIRYVGNLYGNRNVVYFIKTLEIMIEMNEIPDYIHFDFVGNYYAETIKLLKSSKVEKFITIIPQVSHRRAIEYMLSSDLLLFFVATKDGNDFITGKIFEYIRAKRPILAMIPVNSEIEGILKDSGHKLFCAMEDVQGIRNNLNMFISDPERFNEGLGYDVGYSRESQTTHFL